MIALLHDLIPLAVPAVHSARYKAFFWLTLQSLRWADAVVTETASTRRDFMRLKVVPGTRVRVVPAGPGLTPLLTQERPERTIPNCTPANTPAAPCRERFILYVGGHSPHKNVPRLVTAFSHLRTPTDTRLYLVGWGKEEHIACTRRAIETCGVGERVVLFDRLTDDELSLLYRNCLLFVFPSLYEGFGLPVLEALAHGAPVACSRTSSLPEVAGDAALYFNPYSVGEMEQSMWLLLNDQSLSAALRRRATERARIFTWDRTAEVIIDCARSVLARTAR